MASSEINTHSDAERILERITDAFYALDHEWRFTYVNAQAERLVRRPSAELLGRVVWEEFPEAVGSGFERAYRRAMAEQTLVTVEEYFPPLSTWFEVRAFPSPDGLSVFFQDVNVRKQAERDAEQAQRESEERFHLLMEGTAMGTWRMDVRSGVTAFSPRMAELYLLPPEPDGPDAPFESLMNSVHPDDVARVQETVERSILDMGLVRIEHRVVGRGGEGRWIEGHGRTFACADGQPSRFEGVALDITKRKRAEEALRRSEALLRDAQARLEAALSAGGIATWTYDLIADRVVADAGLARLFSVSPEDGAGGKLAAYLQAIHPDDRPYVAEAIADAVAHRETYEAEYRVVLPGGSHRWLTTRGKVERDARGKAVALPGVVQDITERVEGERRGRFLAALAERAQRLTDPDGVIADAVRSLGEFLGASRVVFADIDLAADACTIPLDYCADENVASMAGTFPISAFGPFLVGEYGAGRIVAADDVRGDPERFPPASVAAYDAVACRAFVVAPVLHSTRLVSVLAVHTPMPRHWTPEEVELIQAVVERTWLTVEVLRQQRALAQEAEERREAHERTAVILDSITDASYALDAQFRFTHVNRQAEALWGRPREEFLGQSFLEMWPQAAGSISFAQHEYAMAEREPTHYEVISPVLGRWLEASVYPTADGGLSVFFRDISGRKGLEAERERLAERERNIASQLQSALQPDLPGVVPGLSVTKYYEAALADEAGVGGDFYDVFGIEKGRTALVVGDLSGKGLLAAAQVSTVRNMLRAFLYSKPTVAEAVTDLNRVLAENNLLAGFSTLFVGAFDGGTGTLTFVNCGQEPGLLRRAGTGAVERLLPTGPILGTFENVQYTEATVSLAPGDALAVFSDGLTEVGPNRREMLGVEGVSSLLSEPVSEETARDAEEMVQHLALRLIAGVDAAAAGGVMRDDVCLLIAVVEGAEGERLATSVTHATNSDRDNGYSG